MKKKRVLVFAGGPILPVKGMHQSRILNQIISLAVDHQVDFCFLYSKKSQKKENETELIKYCGNVIPIKTITQTFLYKVISKLILQPIFHFFAIPHDHFTLSNLITSIIIAQKINRKRYDLIISHYWQASGFLRFLNKNILKAIDTHYLVEENIDLYFKGHYSHIDNRSLKKLLKRELKLQKKYFNIANLLIVNSEAQLKILKNEGYAKPVIYIPNGQKLDKYLNLPILSELEELYLLFYGSLQNQFNQKALIRLLDNIFPTIQKNNPKIKLIILGADPPSWLYKKTANNPNILITGFVSDIGKIFKKCFACILPIDSASGFRGRTVELLASGVPVIGTENALQSVQITHGVNGIIAETDEEFINWVLKMASDKHIRKAIAEEGRKHAVKNFSLESTHYKLSQYLNNINFSNNE